jgi:DNA phosphorothioation system restriction enzyme
LKLADLTLGLQFRSGQHIIAKDFYERCLPISTSYSRAVGFFSSSVFTCCPTAFYEFFHSDGRMKVVSSPYLQRSDISAIAAGYRDSQTIIKTSQLELLLKPPLVLQSRLAELISWLVATRRLDVRIALVADDTTGYMMYHEKLGLFEDRAGNCVAFSGSANESRSGVKDNFEVVDLYRSWERFEARRAERKREDFAALWHSETARLEVFPFPVAMRLGKLRPAEVDETAPRTIVSVNQQPLTEEDRKGLEETLGIPGDVILRKHQRRAVEAWFANDGRGMLEMATGSGKTIAALAIATALYNTVDTPLFIIVVCPYLHLVYQWREQALEFGLDPIPCAHATATWREELATRLYNAKIGGRRIVSVVTTNATFAGPPFQKLMRASGLTQFLIADEVHNLGASQLRSALPEMARFRLGLSATPERWFDPEGTQALESYFDKVVFSYTLAQGLEDGILCRYRYYPLLVELTETEMEHYYKLTVELARLSSGAPTGDSHDPLVEALLLRRARLIATAQNKMPLLRERFVPLKGSTHNLVYCGDGTVESPADGSITRQIEAVVRMLGRDAGMLVARYTADTELDRRSELRRNFASGVLQCLVAIRCLDEGVDIPETRRAFILASSTNPRQFIQRRGRVLRTAPGKEFAEIYDFVVEPPVDVSGPDSPYFNITRNLFSRELDRISEFARLALNGPEAMHRLLQVRKRLHLLDHM